MKAKLITSNGEFKEVDIALNDWFDKNPGIKVKFTNQSECVDSDTHKRKLTITIFYEKK